MFLRMCFRMCFCEYCFRECVSNLLLVEFSDDQICNSLIYFSPFTLAQGILEKFVAQMYYCYPYFSSFLDTQWFFFGHGKNDHSETFITFHACYVLLKQIDVATYYISAFKKWSNPCGFCVPWFLAVIYIYMGSLPWSFHFTIGYYLGAQLDIFGKVAQSLQRCRPPWLADEEDFEMRNG